MENSSFGDFNTLAYCRIRSCPETRTSEPRAKIISRHGRVWAVQYGQGGGCLREW